MATAESTAFEVNGNPLYLPYHAHKDAFEPLGFKEKTEIVPIAESVHVQTVVMTDDSMSPVFRKGDVLTIDYENECDQSGHYMLIAVGPLLLIRRFIVREPMDFCYWPESSSEHEIVDDGMVNALGVVTEVKRADGTTEVPDLKKMAFADRAWVKPPLKKKA
jgi:hypothetical protein